MTAAAIALVGLLVAVAGACGSASAPDAEVPAEGATVAPARGAAIPLRNWQVDARVTPARMGALGLAVTDLKRAKRTSSAPWIKHELVFRNHGDRPLTIADTRSSKFIGAGDRNRLLAADEGCGYGQNRPRGPVQPGACLLYLDRITVKPHGSESRAITLFKGLPGMHRLVPDTYVFRRPVRFRIDGRERGARVARLIYAISSR